MIPKLAYLLASIVEQLKKDDDPQTLRNSKMLLDVVTKIVPIIMKIQDLQSMEDGNLKENDLAIIANFVAKNKEGGSERGI